MREPYFARLPVASPACRADIYGNRVGALACRIGRNRGTSSGVFGARWNIPILRWRLFARRTRLAIRSQRTGLETLYFRSSIPNRLGLGLVAFVDGVEQLLERLSHLAH